MTSEDAKEKARSFFNEEYDLGDDIEDAFSPAVDAAKAAIRKLLADIFVAFSKETGWVMGRLSEGGLVLAPEEKDDSWFSGHYAYEMPIDIRITPDDLVSAFDEAYGLWEDEDKDDLREAVAKWRAAVEKLEEKLKRD